MSLSRSRKSRLEQAANAYDSSPQGRIFQVEYAQEAVKQGSVVVGLVSKTHAVLVALKVYPISFFITTYLYQYVLEI